MGCGPVSRLREEPAGALPQHRRRARGSLVSDRLGGSLLFGIGFFDWVQLSAELPLVLYQQGQRDIPGVTVNTLPALRSVGLGDLRLLPKVRLLRSEDQGIDLAFQLGIGFPTGGGSEFLGDRAVTLTPELAISRAFGGFRLAGNLGISVLHSQQQLANLAVGNELTWRLGAGFRFHEHNRDWVPLELDASLSSATSLSSPYRDANQQALEARAMAAWHFSNHVLPFIGAGFGLQPGYGTPDWRLFAGLRFGLGGATARLALPVPEPTVVVVPVPRAPEPIVDQDPDHDGVLGAADKCPTVPEDLDGFEDDDGCPDPDNDQDGIADTVDLCPMVKGPLENRGCPDVDTDGDTVVDRLDNCPKEPGPPKNQGCKEEQLVIITGDKLRILESVYFQTGKAIIERRSYHLLDNVASIMSQHDEITLLRVEGHTDSQGDDVKNLKLSQARAESVRDYLVNRGVASSRLKPLGFGEARPIADNGTKDGRAQNRRVEFNLGEER